MPTALPGDPLGPSSKFRPGAGTHLHASQLHASLLGPVSRSSAPPLPTDTPNAKPSPNPALTIAAQRNPNSSFVSKSSTTLPEVNTIVLGRVTRLRQREAVVEILVSDDEVLETGSFQGVVMSQDVRATEKDRVKIREMFRVGDIVRGIVISLGDQSSYYLSTARNDLGVIMATSEQGNTMYPISWREFKDPETGETEARKVAKPF